MTIPAMHGILANWAPPEERGQMSSFVYAGEAHFLQIGQTYRQNCLPFYRSSGWDGYDDDH